MEYDPSICVMHECMNNLSQLPTIYFNKANGSLIEWVDEAWLHVHHSMGMTSVVMTSNTLKYWVSFLEHAVQKQMDLSMMKKPSSMEEDIFTDDEDHPYTFISELGCDANFNLSIVTESQTLVLFMHFNEIKSLINKIKTLLKGING